MNDQEKARVVVEKVHGWPIGGYTDRKGPYPIILEDHTGLRVARNSFNAEPYSPGTNVAQAFEAADKHGLFDDEEVCLGRSCDEWDVFRMSQYGNRLLIASAKTVACAITNALVKAVSDD